MMRARGETPKLRSGLLIIVTWNNFYVGRELGSDLFERNVPERASSKSLWAPPPILAREVGMNSG